MYGVDLPKGSLHSKLRDGSQAKLDMLVTVLKGLMQLERGTLPPKVIPKIRQDVEPHFNPSAFRQKLDVERNAETEALSRRFYEVYKTGVFTAWKCTYDVGRGRPENPEALVGAEVAQTFDGCGNTIFLGAITAYNEKRRWWKVVYDDGDSAEYNFRELTKLVQPPDFSPLTYGSYTACDQYLSEVPSIGDNLQTDNVFRLEGTMYKMINVFCDETTFKFWCAYCPLEDHFDGLEDYSRASLRVACPDVDIALYEDVKAWVHAYEKDTATRGPSDGSESDEEDHIPLAVLLGAFR